jgi:hypothetical protein
MSGGSAIGRHCCALIIRSWACYPLQSLVGPAVTRDIGSRIPLRRFHARAVFTTWPAGQNKLARRTFLRLSGPTTFLTAITCR